MTEPPRHDASSHAFGGPVQAAVRGAVRGACPSVHQPLAEADGNLARVRVPAGLLGSAGARAFAGAVEAVGGSVIEMTNRANLQVRGVSPASTTLMRDLLVAAELVADEPEVDERRNVLASPMSSIDPGELVDPTPHLAAVLDCLASPAAAALSPKFGVLVDGGGLVHVRDRAHDLALGAVRELTGRTVFEVRLAGALDERAASPYGSCWVVEPDEVAALVEAVVALTGDRGRVGALLDEIGAVAVYEELSARIDGMAACAMSDLELPTGESESPVGIRPQRQVGRVSVGAIVPLGRIAPPTLRAVADLADSVGMADLRISPWRQVVLSGVADADARAVAQELDTLGLIVDPAHPAGVVVACVGSAGCASAFTDTLADAEALIGQFADEPVASRPRSVHVSGCEKGCAYPGRAEVSLVGTAGGAYAVHRRDRTVVALDPVEQRFGGRVQTALLPEPARNAAIEIGHEHTQRVHHSDDERATA
ncbi:MAG TPA: precorrin-3B synthase [Acidimicrobiia bacterium]|nr:precorrin-3B synthase [Acidimicrobiia bacterium]